MRTFPGLVRAAVAAGLGLLVTSTTCTTSGPTGSPEEISSGRAAVNAELQRYALRVAERDHSAIAEMFAPSGVLVTPEGRTVQGRDDIDRYLRETLKERSAGGQIAPARTIVRGDTARQAGVYEQRLRRGAGDTLRVTGRFEATWLRVRPGEWRILRLETRPDRK